MASTPRIIDWSDFIGLVKGKARSRPPAPFAPSLIQLPLGEKACAPAGPEILVGDVKKDLGVLARPPLYEFGCSLLRTLEECSPGYSRARLARGYTLVASNTPMTENHVTKRFTICRSGPLMTTTNTASRPR